MLYQYSYLGYGLKSARGSVHRLVEFMMVSVSKPHAVANEDNVPNPCWTQGIAKEAEILQVNGEKNLVLTAGKDIGHFDSCKRVLELVMAKDACRFSRCIFVC